VLGLGDIGAMAGKPVMEGKALLFKIYAGIDVFDIEINEKDPKKFIEIVKGIAPTFGGINLEDIKAPECFEIEDELKEALDIPVMHDDQHGTAIISAAGLLNAIELANKNINEIKMVVNGAGAAASACTRLYLALGLKKENLVMVDSKGVINEARTDLSANKKEFMTDRNDLKTLADALVGADVFLGLSKGNILTRDMVRSMADVPVVFALANPTPEMSYEEAMASRGDLIFATGRSDYPNQVNNVIGFPYIFRGALDVRASTINEEMKLAAVRAIAKLAHEPVPDVVNIAYNAKRFSFGKEYLIPKPLDPRLLTEVSMAVAKAAVESGVARKPITNWDAYYDRLRDMMGYDNKMMRGFTETARSNPKRVVFAEGMHINMIKAAVQAKNEGVAFPILLGNPDRITMTAQKEHLDLSGIQIINTRSPEEFARRREFALIFTEENGRNGVTFEEARDDMYEPNHFGMMMVKTGHADAFITGVYSKYSESIALAKSIIGIRDEYKHFGALQILSTKKGVFFLADTLINRSPDADTLVNIAKLTHDAVRFFAHEPVMAMLSYSNFGADQEQVRGTSSIVSNAVAKLHSEYPNYVVDGEMQVNFALNKDLRDNKYRFNKLKGKTVNTLIFPCLSSANTTYQMLLEMGVGESIGPIQMGLKKPIHFTDVESTVRDIFNLTVAAVIDAIVQEKKDAEKK
ncbi:MAG TPA: NADP-dependent malic enzyme, partial [Fibrobacter sp.]|nr:NADP-dependent malic enzyme [Fibrobacter sp.]